jgi:hypothetical protein
MLRVNVFSLREKLIEKPLPAQLHSAAFPNGFSACDQRVLLYDGLAFVVHALGNCSPMTVRVRPNARVDRRNAAAEATEVIGKIRAHFLYMHGRKRSDDTEKRAKEARCRYVPG